MILAALPSLPPELQPWFVSLLIVAMIATLLTGRFGPDIVFMGILTALVVGGVIDVPQAVSGFANPGLITVALLYVVAAGMKQTGAMNMLTARLLGRPKTALGAQAKLVLPVATMSAFVNNTPIVAMFLPVLSGVARRSNIPVSKLFMPLSFASILGGTCTLIGTSTNVIIGGLLVSEDIRDAGGEPVRFGMFTLAAVGLPIAIVGIAYILILGRRLLPGTAGADDHAAEAREYMTALRVPASSPIIGRTIEAAGLRHLPGIFLSRIDRGGSTIIAAAPTEGLREGDVLVFVGRFEGVLDLQQIRGLEPIEHDTADEEAPSATPRHRRELIEAVVSPASRVVGSTIRDAGFRSLYAAVVVAVHRGGQRLDGRIGDIRLRPGDTLLLKSEPGFADRYRDSRDFYLVTQRSDAAAPFHSRAWAAIA
ncbi:MAG: SLC13 family permease, partial [Planctomycetota bacterium]